MPPWMRVFGTPCVSIDLDPRRPLHRAEVLGRRLDLVFGHPLRDRDHHVRIRLPRLGALAHVAPEVVHRLDEVGDRQSRHASVLGTALAVRVVAQAARAHVGLAALCHDLRHRRMIAGNQSAGPKASRMFASGKLSVLPGSVLGVGIGSWLCRRCTPGRRLGPLAEWHKPMLEARWPPAARRWRQESPDQRRRHTQICA